jgi:hypothetical protein
LRRIAGLKVGVSVGEIGVGVAVGVPEGGTQVTVADGEGGTAVGFSVATGVDWPQAVNQAATNMKARKIRPDRDSAFRFILAPSLHVLIL